MGQVTERDVELVDQLIRKPDSSLDEIGKKLGITRQAVGERKSRLEEAGFTKSFYFWDITPRFECTKRVLIKVPKGFERINSILKVFDRFNPVVVFFRDDPEEFFEGKASSLTETINEVEGVLLFNNGEEEGQLVSELEELGVTSIVIEPVLFSRLLGENCDLTLKSPEQIEGIATDIAQKLSSEPSVQAVLCGMPFHTATHERPVDQFDLLVIRDERFQPEADSYERRVKQTLVDYHFTNLGWFMQRVQESAWLRNMRIVYARNESLRRKIQREIERV